MRARESQRIDGNHKRKGETETKERKGIGEQEGEKGRGRAGTQG